MSKTKPEWFLAPNDVKPQTSIALGRIITDPLSPEGPPYFDPALPIPQNATTVFNYPWTREVSHERAGMLGMFASFMANVGLGGDVSVHLGRQDASRVEVANLETVKFEPSDDYVEKSLNSPRNMKILGAGLRRTAYVITGVKTAYGGRKSWFKGSRTGGNANFGVSPTIPSLQVGPKAEFNQKIEESEEIGDPVDFVYAYRLNKVHYSRRKERLVQSKYAKGAVFSQPTEVADGDSACALEDELIGRDEIGSQDEHDGLELVGMEEEPAGQDEFDFRGYEVRDEGGEICTLLTPSVLQH